MPFYTYEYDNHFKILPAIHEWSSDPGGLTVVLKVSRDFTYCSDNNPEWMSVEQLQAWIKQNPSKLVKSA